MSLPTDPDAAGDVAQLDLGQAVATALSPAAGPLAPIVAGITSVVGASPAGEAVENTVGTFLNNIPNPFDVSGIAAAVMGPIAEIGLTVVLAAAGLALIVLGIFQLTRPAAESTLARAKSIIA